MMSEKQHSINATWKIHEHCVVGTSEIIMILSHPFHSSIRNGYVIRFPLNSRNSVLCSQILAGKRYLEISLSRQKICSFGNDSHGSKLQFTGHTCRNTIRIQQASSNGICYLTTPFSFLPLFLCSEFFSFSPCIPWRQNFYFLPRLSNQENSVLQGNKVSYSIESWK